MVYDKYKSFKLFLIFCITILLSSVVVGGLSLVSYEGKEKPADAVTWSIVSSPISYNITTPYTGQFSGAKAWTMENGVAVSSGNKGIDSSYSSFLLTVNNAAVNDTLTFSYMASSEASCDVLNVYANNAAISGLTNTSGNYTSYTTYTYTFTKSGTNTFEFVYRKDGSINRNNDCIKIKSIVIRHNFTVSFNSNGGTACSNKPVLSSTSGTCTYGSLPTPTKNGYTFYGWYRNSNLTGEKVKTSDSFTSNHTLYAKWGTEINFNFQGGTGGTTTINNPVNEIMNTITLPTLSGYTFAGYYTEPLGKGVQYYGDRGQSTHINDLAQGTILYASWQSTINLDLQGGTGDTSLIAIYNDNMPELLKPVRSGYTFGGYFTSKNGAGTRYYTNSMSSAHLNDLPNGTTLYAYWMINTYVLYYNPNGGSVSSTETSVTFGATITPPTPTRSGYTFFGWYIDGERYSGGIWTYTENKTAIAKWGYTLTYNANGGYVHPGSITITDSDVIIPPTPVRDGCIFAGWTIGGNDYNGGLWTFTANQTATAKWICSLDVSVNDNLRGYYTGNDIGSYAVGTNITLTAIALDGYTFDSWIVNNKRYTNSTYTGTLNRNTVAVAYFKEARATANVYATNGTIAQTLLELDEENFSATLMITPEANKYIQSISFDNVMYYTIDSWYTKLYANSGFAQNVAYYANEGNNNLWITFNYYDMSKSVNVYVTLTTQKYTDLNMPPATNGTLDGIAVSANYGGSVTLVGADYETLADSDEIICTAKLAQQGYEFVGWCFADFI